MTLDAIRLKAQDYQTLTHDEYLALNYLQDYAAEKWAWTSDLMDLPGFPGSEMYLIATFKKNVEQLRILTYADYAKYVVGMMVNQAGGNLAQILPGKQLVRTTRVVRQFIAGQTGKGAVGVILLPGDPPFLYIPSPFRSILGSGTIMGQVHPEHYEVLDEVFTTEKRFYELYDFSRRPSPNWFVQDTPVIFPGYEGCWRVWEVSQGHAFSGDGPYTFAAVPYGTRKPRVEPRIYGRKLKGDTYTYIHLAGNTWEDVQIAPEAIVPFWTDAKQEVA
jgi:hypothetical protein